MKRQYSMPEYYQLQGYLATKYSIVDFHAGCHIVNYPHGNICNRCTFKNKCAEIYSKEKDSDIYITGMSSVKEE